MLAKDTDKKIILTGDRPTGRLHLGHYAGSLKGRVELQNSGEFDEINVLIADDQALTDNWSNPQKIRDNMIEVALDYLSVGIDPDKTTICVQSNIPALHALTFYYMNLVTTQRLSRNPTVKAEMVQRGFSSAEGENDNQAGLPAGFFTYPVSQAADITAFKATTVPVGEDQEPMIEQTREIVRKFNATYGCDVLVEPDILLSNQATRRLPGIDGRAKMSKSLGNCIYLSEDSDSLKKKVMSMYTDPNHINVADPGQVEGNMVFTYLDAFCTDEMFTALTSDYACLDEMKEHYRKGGLGDVKCKKLLISVLEEMLSPIRERRARWAADIPQVYAILRDGTRHAVEETNQTLAEVTAAMKVDYFKDEAIIGEWERWINRN